MTPAAIRAARQSLGLTQAKAAALIGVALRTWQCYEYGTRRMPEAMWRLWRHCAGIEAIPFPVAATPPTRP